MSSMNKKKIKKASEIGWLVKRMNIQMQTLCMAYSLEKWDIVEHQAMLIRMSMKQALAVIDE